MKYLKNFEDVFLYDEDFYVLDLDELWKTYFNNFEQIHPEHSIRNKSRDIKTICHYFRIDIVEILVGKEIDIEGIIAKIQDVWSRYSGDFRYIVRWEFKVRLSGKPTTAKSSPAWKIIGKYSRNNKIRVSGEKSELEKKLEFFKDTSKYNL